MKPILFNTEMVRAILDGRKSVTRRVVKPQLPTTACVMKQHRGRASDWFFWEDNDVVHTTKMPFRYGDTLYVRETWARTRRLGYIYRADGDTMDLTVKCWCPSIHMPKEAARLFLRVTDVRVERLQDINGYGVLAEGVDNGKSNPKMGQRWENMQRMSFSDVWDSTIKKADLPLYGWAANPWVWVIEFERISKEEAMKDGT